MTLKSDSTFGLKSAGDVTLSGASGDGMDHLFTGLSEREVTIIAQSLRLWRLDIYKGRHKFKARISNYDSQTNGIGTTETSMNFTPIGPIEFVRAEWWRLVLWYACWPVRVWQRFRG
jgi:hypothetical protein